jgi:hypothetical protein
MELTLLLKKGGEGGETALLERERERNPLDRKKMDQCICKGS